MPVAEAPPPVKTPSRRQRRIVWTLSALAGTLLTIGIVTWRIRSEHAPEEYIPGEHSADITNVVRDQGARAAPAEPISRTPSQASAGDPLLDTGQPLPSGAPEPRFTDVTAQAGLSGFRQFAGGRTSQLPEDMGSGLAWGDFDNDGFDDLFLVSGGGALDLPAGQRAPSLLFRNLGNGRFEQVQDFPETRIIGMGAAWGDYNNDGWLDLAVTGYDTILLFRNEHGHFVRDSAVASPKGFWTGAAWGDFDHSGRLSLYVCGYVKYMGGKGGAASSQFGLEVPFSLNPASFGAERNLLFRNLGGGTFTEAAGELGIANPEGRSLSALWHDFDGDGWLDLYVANDISENKLYLNRGGHFTDAGRAAWVEEYRGSMGLAAADFDRDGDDDLFISHWVAQGDALYQSLLVENRAGGEKNGLHFTDVAEMVGVGSHSLQSIGWGTGFADFDADGWLDLVVANGSTFEQKGNLPRRLVPMPSFLFWNAGATFFHDLAPWNRSMAQAHVSRGLALSDFDNDGAMDIAVMDHGEGVRLLHNEVPHGHWVEFRLHSKVPGSDPVGSGDGATVTAWVGGVALRRSVGSASYLSQDSRRVHIGLGNAAKIDRLEVRWQAGPAESWTGIAADQTWEVTQGSKKLQPLTSQREDASLSPQAAPDRSALVRFWEKQHAAMDSMKREKDCGKAVPIFREALALNPQHEDSHYYLANCLVAAGDIKGALAELDALIHINPQNHRAFQRKGELLAASANSRGQLRSARAALQSALHLNSEETGTLILLGQVDLAAGDLSAAEQELNHACQANPGAANAWFLRGYVAWKQRDNKRAASMLDRALRARGRDWKPHGSVLEGDVKTRMFSESGFLTVFEEQWQGTTDPEQAFRPMDRFLSARM